MDPLLLFILLAGRLFGILLVTSNNDLQKPFGEIIISFLIRGVPPVFSFLLSILKNQRPLFARFVFAATRKGLCREGAFMSFARKGKKGRVMGKITSYLKRFEEKMRQEDGVTVIEVVLVLMVFVSLAFLFREQITAMMEQLLGKATSQAANF